MANVLAAVHKRDAEVIAVEFMLVCLWRLLEEPTCWPSRDHWPEPTVVLGRSEVCYQYELY